VRGLNHPSKQIEVRRIVKEKKIKLVCLIETRVKDHKAGAIVASLFPDWGFCFNYEKHFLCGIWVCWDKVEVDISVIDKSDQCVSCCVHSLKDGSSWFHSFVYGANKPLDRRSLWQHLYTIKNRLFPNPWMLSGDFNVVEHLAEKWGSDSLNSYELEFGECLNDLEVIDLKFSGFFLLGITRVKGLVL